MALANYDELVVAVQSFLVRTDLTGIIPTFVRAATSRFDRVLRIRQQHRNASGTFLAGDQTLALPDDFLEVVSFAITDTPRQMFSYLSPDIFFSSQWLNEAGRPRFCTLRDQFMHLAPFAQGGENWELWYYGKLDTLGDSVQTNAVFDIAPDLYLYATLCEAEPFLMNDERIAVWQQKREEALDELNGMERRMRSKSMGQRARWVP